MSAVRAWPQAGEALRPASVEMLAQQIAYAEELGTSVGGPNAAHPIDFSALTAPIQVSAADMIATAQVGHTLASIKTAVAIAGLWLPLDSYRGDDLTLADYFGDDFSLSWLSHRQGTARDWIMGMTALNDNGALIKWGAKVVKNVAGYQLTPLYLGSNHALGPLVEATFRLIPPPTNLTRVKWEATAALPLIELWQKSRSDAHPSGHGEPWEAVRIVGEADRWHLEGLTYSAAKPVERWGETVEGLEKALIETAHHIPSEQRHKIADPAIGRLLPSKMGEIAKHIRADAGAIILYPGAGAIIGNQHIIDEMSATIASLGGHIQGHKGDIDDRVMLKKVKTILDPANIFGAMPS